MNELMSLASQVGLPTVAGVSVGVAFYISMKHSSNKNLVKLKASLDIMNESIAELRSEVNGRSPTDSQILCVVVDGKD